MSHVTKSLRLGLIALAVTAAVPGVVSAQAIASASEHPQSRLDLYGGFGAFSPINSGLNGFAYHNILNPNVTASLTGYFSQHIGVQIEGSYFSGGAGTNNSYGNCAFTDCDEKVRTAHAGPVYRFPLGPAVPFVHALGGVTRMNGPVDPHMYWGYGLTAGGGVDLVLPFAHKTFAIRAFQADYQWSTIDFGTPRAANPYVTTAFGPTAGGIIKTQALKLSAGVVVRFGQGVEKTIPVMFGCSANPTTVYPGDIVTVTGTTVGLKPKALNTAIYKWAAQGGKLTPNGTTATIDTTGLAAGQYDVVGQIKLGPKDTKGAFCSAPFNVKAYQPPTITCVANPSTAMPGTPIEIACDGKSPQNRPLTYAYTTSAGQVSGAGHTAQLSTAGLPASTISVTGMVTDDMAQSARSTVEVLLTNPPAPIAAAKPNAMCTLNFTRDARRPSRVDNEAKGCLDDIAVALNQKTDAKLVIVGNSAPNEKPNLAAERALNARRYLVDEKGIDPARVTVRVGGTTGKTAMDIVVPAGATYSDTGTQTFDEHSVARSGQPYAGFHTAPAAKHKAKKAAPAVPATK